MKMGNEFPQGMFSVVRNANGKYQFWFRLTKWSGVEGAEFLHNDNITPECESSSEAIVTGVLLMARVIEAADLGEYHQSEVADVPAIGN